LQARARRTLSLNGTRYSFMKPIPSYQKLRGGYYTPKPIADFLAQWAIQGTDTRVLEPSCGDGILIKSATETLLRFGASKKDIAKFVCGIEIDDVEASKAKQHLRGLGIPASSARIYAKDFFSFCKAMLARKELVDAVIGNPPFIRYQNFLEEHRKVAFDLMEQAGLHPNRLTNSWVPFLVCSSFLLSRSGRMGMVIPAELFQVNYAAETRQFLSDFYRRITIITFKKLVFDGIQQEIVLLLGERNNSDDEGIRVVELNNIEDLSSYNHEKMVSAPLKPMDHSAEKWTQYFLEKDEIELLRTLKNHPKITLSGKVIDVDVGVVTGQNEFFVLNEEQIQKYDLKPYTHRIVSRSGHLYGTVFSSADWKKNLKKQLPAILLTAPDVPFEDLPEELKRYVKLGEKSGFHEGYKCRIRNRWYIVPSVWIPQAFMLRQVHSYPKIVLNKGKATCTDTVHRVNFVNGARRDMEVTGRSYGGGVLTFEPSEAERLPLPLVGAEQLDFKQINNLVRENNIKAVLDITDQVLLRQGMGLSAKETRKIRGIWEKLSNRRVNRKHRK
jgi:adenine-specific DNA-methyltransferase